jgi:hypothetical protein
MAVARGSGSAQDDGTDGAMKRLHNMISIIGLAGYRRQWKSKHDRDHG